MLPATTQGLRKYLGSGLIKGIGPKTAEKIVAQFDVGTLDILEQHLERLLEVPGLGPHKVSNIWSFFNKAGISFLYHLSVSPPQAKSIFFSVLFGTR